MRTEPPSKRVAAPHSDSRQLVERADVRDDRRRRWKLLAEMLTTAFATVAPRR